MTDVPRQSRASKVLESTPLLILLAVGDLIALAVFLSSKGLRTWVGHHGYLMFLIALAAILLIPVALAVQRNRVEPDPRDVALVAQLRTVLGANAEVVGWVRNDFAPNRFSVGLWDKLGDIYREWSDDPARRFVDTRTQRAYEALLRALGEFKHRTDDETWHHRGLAGFEHSLGLPPEWQGEQPERWRTAVNEIDARRTAFLNAVDDFASTAHARGL